jgi:hypothetical protein
MKVCAYVMTVDSGLAPNPFHGVCTLSVCTPNHVNANLKYGDYIIGIAGIGLSKKLKNPSQPWRLLYVMKIDERKELGDYYDTQSYKQKIPKLKGSKIEMCGDNFYKKINGKLVHTGETNDHSSEIPGTGIEKQDCDGNRVFIGRTFYYFGSAAPQIPPASNWGRKLISQLEIRSVNITYILGGSSKHVWSMEDFEEFLKFLNENKLDYLPDPIDFDRWMSEPENLSISSGCS